MSDHPVLLDVADFTLEVRTDAGAAQIIDRASLQVRPGETVGLVGESGCGKSTLVRAILGLLPDHVQVLDGQIRFDGENLLDLDERGLSRRIRGRRIGFIPQDPFLSFNPLFRIGTQLLEIMRWHAPNSGRNFRAQHLRELIEVLHLVNIADPAAAIERFPHEFSGGQLQRLMIAGTLACHPDLILADEPTSALDVTTQQQILLILKQLAKEAQVAVLLVTHDFGVVAQLCDTVTVMYAGQTVETARTRELLRAPMHPYTRMLLDCHPDRSGALTGIPGLVPPATDMPPGCRFCPRCPQAVASCSTRKPAPVTHAGHALSCLRYQSDPLDEVTVAFP